MLSPSSIDRTDIRAGQKRKLVDADQAGSNSQDILSESTDTGAQRSQFDKSKSKTKKATVARKTNAATARNPVNQPVECVIEWPDFFKTLEKTYRALNLVYTFCCTRKHLATTFDTIKSTVESHIKRPLTIEDVAGIVAIRPEGIMFAYVDETMLQLDVKGTERDDTFKTGSPRNLRTQAPAPDASVGGVTGLEGLAQDSSRDLDIYPREVLYFEFVDGDLKREVQDKKTGEPTRPFRKLRDEDLKMPVYSQKQMTLLIERRNTKFTNAVSMFINRCVDDNLDPEIALKHTAQSHIPVPSISVETLIQDRGKIPETIPKERKSIPEIVQELKESSWYSGQIVPDGHRVFEPQEAVYGDLNFLLSQDLVNAMYNAKGITQFYAHQADALNSLLAGQNVVVATSTSSGKSLIYQLPVLYALEKDRDARAMYIFPTKALAQDQKRSLRELIGYMPGLEHTLVETFDGDTPMNERNLIREEAKIIFTNPDMLHITILPQEERWRTFLKNLKYVVGRLSHSQHERASLLTDSSRRIALLQWPNGFTFCFHHEAHEANMCCNWKPSCEIRLLLRYSGES
jgi:DEAD/DEAH box helicase domain-containing protein